MHPLLLCLALFAVTGWGQTSPVAKPASTPTVKKSAVTPKAAGHSSSNDAEIEKAIRAKLAASKISKDKKFEVHVQGGVATLTGKTDVLQHKGTATRLAKNAGASKVVNHIEVSDAAKEKAASNLDSGRRRAQVKRSDVASRQ